MSSRIRIERNGPVTRVALARPDLHNAFDAEMISELTQAFTDVGKDPATRVVLLYGDGASFCAGADVNWMRGTISYSQQENEEDARRLHGMLETLYRCPKPTIAKVHGAAFGGGVGLLSCVDVAVGSEKAVLSLSETKLGILPAVIGTFVLRKIGPAAYRAYGLSAKKMTAEEALRVGFLQEVVPAADLDRAIDRWAGLFLENGPEAMATLKSLSEEIASLPIGESAEIATRTIARVRVGKEGQEGLRAFLEKRPATWLPKR